MDSKNPMNAFSSSKEMLNEDTSSRVSPPSGGGPQGITARSSFSGSLEPLNAWVLPPHWGGKGGHIGFLESMNEVSSFMDSRNPMCPPSPLPPPVGGRTHAFRGSKEPLNEDSRTHVFR